MAPDEHDLISAARNCEIWGDDELDARINEQYASTQRNE